MWRWGCWYLAGLSVHVNAAVSVGGSIQSTLASFHRPFLEILTPLNGQVVESSEVDIELVVRDYIMPSSFRTYKVCLGIHENTAISSDGASVGVVEFCFDQTSSKQFHVQNLLPGTSYTVRVVLVDKGTVIAVSMRTFRVAAIAIQGHTENVTILTAMQYALSYQNNLDTDSAMRIYESILAEAPGHGHALHLLGLAKYQRGDTMEAIDYIEQALQTNATHEEFHNSLGLCLKDIGRTAEAATHFETAMSLRPSYIEPRFNLASIWQSTGEYDLAIPVFRAMADKVHSQTLALEYAAQFDVFVRLCDIYLASKQQNMALECLNEALVLWPNDPTFLNDRGSLYLNVGSDKLSYFLSFANLAPIQAAWGLGHPETTGVPAIDYMVTSEYEHLSFHDHYTETPFPLKGMGIYLKEPLTPHISTYANSSPDDVRATLTQAFHLPSEYRFYFVPEPLVNVHPDMDSIVRRILKRDPIGHVFFLTPPKNSKWKHAFTERIKLQPGLPAHRIHLIIDALDDISTFALLRACDVHLANLYTNKFYHTLEASAAGVPTITLPGELWRSRIPLGLLKHINVLDTVATTPAEYVQLAVRAASDRSFRHQVVGKLQKYAPKLYGDDEAVHEWARFLQFAVDKSRRKRKTHANLRALQDNPTHSTNGLAPPTAKDVTL
ncbi:hypothetical protein DYB32_001836 [Aphanomyces invadans]|uniref:protein O-GlcNAc transferase n=1 Tax=Aphanomyces invadans TaxID=157072 RepID=A0A3R7AFV0_9STRA|nr:hypothetical protein DYB32_001836 [Aphanomyces invadans]